MDTVVGRIPVLACLDAGKRKPHALHLLRSGKDLEPLVAAAAGIPIREVSRGELDQLSGGVPHQGAVLEADPLPTLKLVPWLEAHAEEETVILVLDGIEDPHNFGAIVRSAGAFGGAAVLFGKDRSAPLSPASLKAAAGAMEYVDLIQETNLARAIQALQRHGFWVAALDAEADKALWDADLKGRTALVVGNEGRGIRRLIRERCDFGLRIPLRGAIPSLNVSVSAAIALAECARQRQIPNANRQV